MRLFVLGFVSAALLVTSAPEAWAQRTWYAGPHPIHKRVLKGMCYIPVPHVHNYAPANPLLYVRTGKHHNFVGDPVEHELEAPRYAYYGHHPVFWVQKRGAAKHYCYITGPHHHWYKPPGHLKFKQKGNAYWYVGGHPAWYKKDHPRAKMLRTHYHSIGIPLPEVKVAAPVGFVGVVVGGAWLTGHLLLKYRGGRWYGHGPRYHRWHGHKWKRPKWRRGHWRSKRWGKRWGKRRWKHRGKRYRKIRVRRRRGKRYGKGGGARHRRGK